MWFLRGHKKFPSESRQNSVLAWFFPCFLPVFARHRPVNTSGIHGTWRLIRNRVNSMRPLNRDVSCLCWRGSCNLLSEFAWIRTVKAVTREARATWLARGLTTNLENNADTYSPWLRLIERRASLSIRLVFFQLPVAHTKTIQKQLMACFRPINCSAFLQSLLAFLFTTQCTRWFKKRESDWELALYKTWFWCSYNHQLKGNCNPIDCSCRDTMMYSYLRRKRDSLQSLQAFYATWTLGLPVQCWIRITTFKICIRIKYIKVF